MGNITPGRRAAKLAGNIQAAVSDYLVRNLANVTPGFITVSQVQVSSDLRVARIYFSILGSDRAVASSFRKLIRHRGRIRYHIGQEVLMRYVPEIRILLDTTPAQAERIQKLLNELED